VPAWRRLHNLKMKGIWPSEHTPPYLQHPRCSSRAATLALAAVVGSAAGTRQKNVIHGVGAAVATLLLSVSAQQPKWRCNAYNLAALLRGIRPH
jgi:hypothetical protein